MHQSTCIKSIEISKQTRLFSNTFLDISWIILSGRNISACWYDKEDSCEKATKNDEIE